MRDQNAKTSRTKRTNAAAKYSIRYGDDIQVGKTKYRGKNPVYSSRQAHVGAPIEWFKSERGIPFVRVV